MVTQLHDGVQVPAVQGRIVGEALLVLELLGAYSTVHEAIVTTADEKQTVVVEHYGGTKQSQRQWCHLLKFLFYLDKHLSRQ